MDFFYFNSVYLFFIAIIFCFIFLKRMECKTNLMQLLHEVKVIMEYAFFT